MRTEFQTGMPRENSHGRFLRFMKYVAQIPYFTPKMDARYAFFFRERSIFNLWQISIISMAVFHREQWYAAPGSRFDVREFRDYRARPAIDALPSGFAGAAMTLRAVKMTMVFAVALYYTLLVFNNITDFNSNYQFVRHVVMMDSIFPENRGMWRALNQPAWHLAFYISTIAWEFLTMILCWWGGYRMALALRGTAVAFARAKRISIVALALALLMWLVAFLTIAGEWFLMWQSKVWNGQEAAVRMFTVIGIVLLLVALPDTEGQP
jgi:predicted small integral membrane protein